MNKMAKGFTLIEVLVALMVMAVMATMAWQGVWLNRVVCSMDCASAAWA